MLAKKLQQYRSMRDFAKTPEPKGKVTTAGNTFVVQKHAARRLHYDLRLELKGALKSWAVPKGIPTKYNEKHLAIETEDHPLEYAKFEGTIPAGEYGAGTVKIWDAGEYELVHVNVKKGIIEFKLHGHRYKGTYALVRFKQENNKNQWLLFRVKDKNEASNPS